MIYDFHGWRHDDAIDEVHKIVGRIRLANKTETAEFITGYGSIRTELIRILEKYGLEPTVKLSNKGVIIVNIL
jgi:hypothetical protein